MEKEKNVEIENTEMKNVEASFGSHIKKWFKKGYPKIWGIRALVLILAFVLGFAAGVCVWIMKPWERDSKNEPLVTTVDQTVTDENFTLTISNVEEILEAASDLITTKYYYTDADTYENYKEMFGKKVPFTTDKVVFTYDGEISIGINLSEVEFDIDNREKIICITLPEIGILTNEVDASSFEYHSVSDSIFNSTEMSDYTDLMATLKQVKAEEVMQNDEVMDQALENAREVLESLLTAADVTKDYDIMFE